VKQITLRITEEQEELLDLCSAITGQERTKLIREAIDIRINGLIEKFKKENGLVSSIR